jgi:Protein of unknown function (DUF2470)
MPRTGFDPASERAIMEHMNTGHVDANFLYAQVYGHVWEATAARLVALDTEGMDLDVTVPDRTQRLRIAFDHRLHDAADAQRTLVAMARYAQAVLTPTLYRRTEFGTTRCARDHVLTAALDRAMRFMLDESHALSTATALLPGPGTGCTPQSMGRPPGHYRV